ncbi:MAG: FtsX-like permease family protein, partial [Bacteroidota bacterium]
GLSDYITSSMSNGAILKSKLEQYPEVKQIAMGTHVFGTPGWGRLAYTDQHNVFRRFTLLVVDAHYLDLFQINMAAGRGFIVGNGLDQRQSVILNQKAVELFGLEDPIGNKLPGNKFGEHQIIGVAEDFHFSSLHSTIEPLVIVQSVAPIMDGVSDVNFSDVPIPKLVFSYHGSPSKAAQVLQEAWKASFPNEHWNMQFLDQRIQAQYEAEMRIRDLVTIATLIAAVIAAMGMLGLSMLVARSKVKEIGIRKVMGASSISIFRLMAHGFTPQIILAILLSTPLTYGLMTQWLDNFAYRTTMTITPFLLASIVSLLIACAVLSHHTVKAALTNPTQSLRNE